MKVSTTSYLHYVWSQPAFQLAEKTVLHEEQDNIQKYRQ